MTLQARLAHPLRLSLTPARARPAFAGGLRAATAIAVPLGLGIALGNESASWAGLAGFLVSLADPGGSYRTRAATMAALMLAGALASGVGAFGSTLAAATLLMLAGGFVAGFARVWGTGATSVGNSAAILFAVSLARPGPPEDALLRAGLALAGGLWAMALSLLLWPVRYYRPARFAVARAYRALADYADAAIALSGSGSSGEADWPALIAARHPSIRQALEDARRTLAAARRGRAGESGRGERLLVLSESAEQAFARLVALLDVLESEREPASDAAARIMAAFARTARELAPVIESEAAPERPLAVARAAPIPAPDDLRDPVARAQLREVARTEARLAEFLEAAVEAAAGLHDDRAAPPTPSARPLARTSRRAAVLLPLRANLSWDSIALRHAARLAIAASAAVLVGRWTGVRYGYWITLAVIIILQPYAGATLVKGLQRVLGTVAGGVVAALVATFLPARAAVLPLAAVLGWMSVVVRPINYAYYAVLATPTFVLLAETRTGDWHLASVRIVDTLLGGAIALLSIALLWPTRERDRFPDAVADGLAALRRYHALALETALGAPAPAARFGEVRRRGGLALINAEASLQRLVTESAGGARTEAAMSLVVYVRRLAASMTALATMAPTPLAPAAAAPLRDLAGAQEAALGELEQAMRAGRAPAAGAFEAAGADAEAALADATSPGDPLLLERLRRISRQIGIVRESVARYGGSR